jgi:hypothetical protein
VSDRACRSNRSRPGHLFLCPACRVERRIAAAWRRFPPTLAFEPPVPVSEDFVRRITAAAAFDRRRRLRRRAVLSVAAGLLFFFLAGAGQQSGSPDSLRPEDSYTQLIAPSALESLLPD